MPVRVIPRKSRSVRGFLPSDKRPDGRPGTANYESTLERDLFQCLEFDPNVRTYEEQPVRFEYEDGGRGRSYTPDVLIEFRDARAPLLVEVKETAELRRAPLEARLWANAGRNGAKARGWEFRVLTEQQIRSPFLANAAFLLPFRGLVRDRALEAEVVDACRSAEDPTPARLAHLLAVGGRPATAVYSSIWAVIADRQLVTDLRSRLTTDSPLTIPARDSAPGQRSAWLRRTADPVLPRSPDASARL